MSYIVDCAVKLNVDRCLGSDWLINYTGPDAYDKWTVVHCHHSSALAEQHFEQFAR